MDREFPIGNSDSEIETIQPVLIVLLILGEKIRKDRADIIKEMHPKPIDTLQIGLSS